MENITAKVSCFARAYHCRNNTAYIFKDTAAGERMKARYDEKEMASLLEECGFLVYEHLDHKGMTDQFFADYNQQNPERSMEAPKGVCYVLAVRQK